MTAIGAFMTTRQLTFAREETTTCDRIPVFCSLDPTFVSVLAADQWEIETYPPSLTSLGLLAALSPHDFSNGCPYTGLTGEKLSITKEVESTPGSGQSNTGTVLRIEEADGFPPVGTHEAEKDNVVSKGKVIQCSVAQIRLLCTYSSP
jgi:hypothetical protein